MGSPFSRPITHKAFIRVTHAEWVDDDKVKVTVFNADEYGNTSDYTHTSISAEIGRELQARYRLFNKTVKDIPIYIGEPYQGVLNPIDTYNQDIDTMVLKALEESWPRNNV